jgi:hypothetical protein
VLVLMKLTRTMLLMVALPPLMTMPAPLKFNNWLMLKL